LNQGGAYSTGFNPVYRNRSVEPAYRIRGIMSG
jgi:hypothetical protein